MQTGRKGNPFCRPFQSFCLALSHRCVPQRSLQTPVPERSPLPLCTSRAPGGKTTSSRIHGTVAIDLKRIYPLIEDLAQRPARCLTGLLDAAKPRQEVRGVYTRVAGRQSESPNQTEAAAI